MSISATVSIFIDLLIEEKENTVLLNSRIIDKGKIIDDNLKTFQI